MVLLIVNVGGPRYLGGTKEPSRYFKNVMLPYQKILFIQLHAWEEQTKKKWIKTRGKLY